MNILQQIFLRLYKQIEVHNSKNIYFGKGYQLGTGSILNAQAGKIFLGKNVRIGKYSELVAAKNSEVQIKDASTLYSNCKILGKVTIERYCVLATNIYMSSGNHFAFEHPELLIRVQDKIVRKKHTDINQPIHIHEDVWIGNGVFISQGITIGRGAVIGAGAIVTKNILPYQVVVGNPAKPIKNRLEFSPPSEINALNQLHHPYFYQGFDHLKAKNNQENHGFKLHDNGIIYMQNGLKTFVISGFSKINTSLIITISNQSEQFEILNGTFKFTFNLHEVIAANYSIIHISTNKSDSIFINSVIGSNN